MLMFVDARKVSGRLSDRRGYLHHRGRRCRHHARPRVRRPAVARMPAGERRPAHGARDAAALRRRERRHPLRARYHTQPLLRRQHQLLGRLQSPVRGLPLCTRRLGAGKRLADLRRRHRSLLPPRPRDVRNRGRGLRSADGPGRDRRSGPAPAEPAREPADHPPHPAQQGEPLLGQGLSGGDRRRRQRHRLSARQRHRT